MADSRIDDRDKLFVGEFYQSLSAGLDTSAVCLSVREGTVQLGIRKQGYSTQWASLERLLPQFNEWWCELVARNQTLQMTFSCCGSHN